MYTYAKMEYNLGGTWRRICSLDTRGDSALEVLRNHVIALYKSTFAFTFTLEYVHILPKIEYTYDIRMFEASINVY